MMHKLCGTFSGGRGRSLFVRLRTKRRFSANSSMTADYPSSGNGSLPLPLPSSPDGADSDSVEQLKVALRNLEKMCEPNFKAESSSPLQDVKDLVQNSMPELGVVFEKIGGAANGQVPGLAGKGSGYEAYKEVSEILKDLGQLHWVGALLIIVALTINRCCKMSLFQEEVHKYMKKLKDLGNHVLKMHGQMRDFEDEISKRTLQKAIQLICDHATYCSHAITKKSKLVRFVNAEKYNQKLLSMQQEIDALYPELILTATTDLIQRVHTGPTGETFEPTEDTEMVRNEERVEEGLRKLDNKNPDSVRALVLVGLPGVGKSTVGQHIAARIKREKNFDKHNCCKVNMRVEDQEIRVKNAQEKLYSSLAKGEKREFSDCAEGKRELKKLFIRRLQDGPALMYFDNVNNEEDLDIVLPDDLGTCLHRGSILLVTTANEGVISVLDKKGVSTRSYRVNELQEKDAKTLLLKKIFADRDISPKSLIQRELTLYQGFWELLQFCNGLPLPINVVGSSIWRKGQNYLRECFEESALHNLSFETAYAKLNPTHREEFLNRLKRAAKHALETLSEGDPINNDSMRLHRSLQFARKQLICSPRIKELFLDIIAVHLGRKWEDVELLCGAEDLATLKQMSMVNRLVYKDGSSGAIVQVHDLLIGMSRRLDNEDSSRRRVVMENMADNADELPECFQNHQILAAYKRPEVVKLHHCGQLSAGKLDRIFHKKLRHLELLSTKITGRCEKTPQNLRFFRCRQSPLPFPLHKLGQAVILDVDLGMGATSSLKTFQAMQNLQKLKMRNSTSLRTLGPELQRLAIVMIEDCPNFENIPGLNPAAVRQLIIANCPIFSDFSSVSHLKCLERLSLAKFEFTEFPEDLVIPSGVQIIDLSRNNNLKVLPKFARGSRIKKLSVRSCTSLEEFRAEMIHSTTLEYLDLGGCAALKRLPSLLDHLPMLKVLDVQGCTEIDRSELRHLVEKARTRSPQFRVIGARFNDEEESPGRCAQLKQYLKIPLRKTRTLDERGPRRSLISCWTFPTTRNQAKHWGVS